MWNSFLFIHVSTQCEDCWLKVESLLLFPRIKNVTPDTAYRDFCLAFIGKKTLTHLTLEGHIEWERTMLLLLCDLVRNHKCNLQYLRWVSWSPLSPVPRVRCTTLPGDLGKRVTTLDAVPDRECIPQTGLCGESASPLSPASLTSASHNQLSMQRNTPNSVLCSGFRDVLFLTAACLHVGMESSGPQPFLQWGPILCKRIIP